MFDTSQVFVTMVTISCLLFSTLIVPNWAIPSMEQFEDLYLTSCQLSCNIIHHPEKAQHCREQFCPNYVIYLLTGEVENDTKVTLVSTNPQEVADFCGAWIIKLVDQLGWHYRIHVNMKECTCAASKDCLIK